MSALWLLPLLVGVVAICVGGVLDTLLHQAVLRIRAEADDLATLAERAGTLVPAPEPAGGTAPAGRAGSGLRADRH